MRSRIKIRKKSKSRNQDGRKNINIKSYDKIIDHLFLGDVNASKNAKFFKDNKIKAVLNCTNTAENTFSCDKNIEYLRIPVDDSLKEEDFNKYYLLLPLAIEFIYKHVDILNNNILVHCHAGMQRSPGVISAYFMSKHKKTLIESARFIIKQRPISFDHGININFLQITIAIMNLKY